MERRRQDRVEPPERTDEFMDQTTEIMVKRRHPDARSRQGMSGIHANCADADTPSSSLNGAEDLKGDRHCILRLGPE